jgi:formate/nitrite transporter FocA (FNT family)
MTPEQADEEGKEKKAEAQNVPEGELIYRAIRQDGDHALSLTTTELAWSGLAAGISMGFSFAAEGVLHAYLGERQWTPLVTKFGYALGFVIVILGRQQLFTEQTLTAILAYLSNKNPEATLSNVARLWAVVLAANIAGAAAFAAVTAWTPAFSPSTHAAFSAIGTVAMSHGFVATLIRGVYAGYLIAIMVWLLPGGGEARLWIVIFLAYIVGVAGFSHVVAGSTDCLYLVFTGQRSLAEYIAMYLVPSFFGNAIGGVGLVATLAHAQHAPAEGG